MYLGRIVEEAPTDPGSPRRTTPIHRRCSPKCRALHDRGKRFAALKGEIPSPLDPPLGCHFHPRCPHVMPRCREEIPVLRDIAPHHRSACHLNDRI